MTPFCSLSPVLSLLFIVSAHSSGLGFLYVHMSYLCCFSVFVFTLSVIMFTHSVCSCSRRMSTCSRCHLVFTVLSGRLFRCFFVYVFLCFPGVSFSSVFTHLLYPGALMFARCSFVFTEAEPGTTRVHTLIRCRFFQKLQLRNGTRAVQNPVPLRIRRVRILCRKHSYRRRASRQAR